MVPSIGFTTDRSIRILLCMRSTSRRCNPRTSPRRKCTPRRQKDGEPITIRNGLDCRCEFSDGRHRSLYGAGLSGPADLARVPCDQAIRNGSVEDGPKHPVGVVARRHVPLADIHVPSATADGVTLLKRTGPRTGIDVPVEHVLVLRFGDWPKIGVGVQPALRPFAERHLASARVNPRVVVQVRFDRCEVSQRVALRREGLLGEYA